MSPTAIPVSTPTEREQLDAPLSKKTTSAANGVSFEDKVLEDYNGNYKFAPIEEAEVSRAMIRRYVPTRHAMLITY